MTLARIPKFLVIPVDNLKLFLRRIAQNEVLVGWIRNHSPDGASPLMSRHMFFEHSGVKGADYPIETSRVHLVLPCEN